MVGVKHRTTGVSGEAKLGGGRLRVSVTGPPRGRNIDRGEQSIRMNDVNPTRLLSQHSTTTAL